MTIMRRILLQILMMCDVLLWCTHLSYAGEQVLHLYSASIEGPIPDTLGALASLQELWLNDNR
jgi:hypothetical protein